MRPDLIEVLESISWSFDTDVAPAVADGTPKSLSYTISNLVRHAKLRAEREGESLAEDIEDLRAVLVEVAQYASQSPDLAELSAELTKPCPPVMGRAGFRGLAQVREEATALRWRLQRAIEQLQAARAAHATEPAYQKVRTAIRQYLDRQLSREGEWIVGAFTGPRR